MGQEAAVEMVLRQLRAVRRRSNLYVVQHAVALWTAAAAGGATLVVLAAVRGGTLGFALAALAGLVVVVAATAILTRRAAGRWLAMADAPGRIDAARGLRGRLASVLDLGGRAHDPFFALLVRQNRDALPRWRPEVVVPEVVPARALLAAVASLAVLALAIVLAPALRAPPPRVEVGDRRIDFIRDDGDTEDADRILVAPGTEHPAAERGEQPTGGTPDSADDAGALAELSASLQDWLQDALGAQEHWEAGEEMPPAGAGGTRDPRHAQRERGPAAPAASGDADAAGGAGAESDTDGPASRRAPADASEPAAEEAAGAGAGTGTDPALFGNPQDDAAGGADRFELAIAARVRTRRGVSMTPWTTAPGAEGGRRTTLAPQRRADQPGHRMAIPPALAPLVRRLYAHPGSGGTP